MKADDPKKRWPTRRRFLWAGTGAVVALAAGAGAYQGGTPWLVRRWAMDVILDNLPGVTIDRPSLAQFAHDALHNDELLQPRTRQILVCVASTMPALARRVEGIARRVEILERRLLSEFLLSSNFFAVVESRAEPVAYAGRVPGCGNTFARFRDS